MGIILKIRKIISDYDELRTKNRESLKSNNPEVAAMLIGLEEEFAKFVEKRGFSSIQVSVSLGQGLLPKTPIVYFRDSRVSISGQAGVYGALILKPSTTEVQAAPFILTLTQGIHALTKEYGKPKAESLLKENAFNISAIHGKRLADAGFQINTTNEELNIRIAEKSYKLSTTASKLWNDIDKLLSVYVSYSSMGADKDISKISGFQSERVIRSILLRRGQPAFRNKLKQINNGKCLVTGCDVDSILEAAHIIPVAENGSMSVHNGLLLRSDIHTLFDLNKLGINKSGKLFWCKELQGHSYYNKFKKLGMPKISMKLSSNLNERFKAFKIADL
ncbi:DUF3578 domain-containing protein [Agarivorans sp. 1_MG-2023]|uniref:MrcB family domain-containing protein n=1 Tax=Agarivorans sp. 1_MG-2023 TaxID=3062634 RepID=UPI0026E43A28|nr:DUF3578 domain-containing protein [Agarivorans sp. 1_MG-2023]MDO6766088.1 DUF3578 domain-containing protein [Agarivorans sp. 1_MG-2023]